MVMAKRSHSKKNTPDKAVAKESTPTSRIAEALCLVERRQARGQGEIHRLPELAIRSPSSEADNSTPDGKKKARISASPETKTLNRTTIATDPGIEDAESTVPSSKVIEIDSDEDSDNEAVVGLAVGCGDIEKAAEFNNLAGSFHDDLDDLSPSHDDGSETFAASFIDDLDDSTPCQVEEQSADTKPRTKELDMETRLYETQRQLTQLKVHSSTTIKPVVAISTDTGGET